MIKIFGICAVTVFFLTAKAYSQNAEADSTSSSDSVNILAQYSLFSEYYKNKDYKSALPYGWTVLKDNPKKFAQWIYFKMEDILWWMHDSASLAPQKVKAIEDTMPYFYNLAIKYDTGDKGYFEVRKAYVSEKWLDVPADTIIAEYEKAIKDDPTVSTYYYDRLGQLYIKTDQKQKAIDLYTKLSEKQPNNQQWPDKLESLVQNIDELIKIDKKAWDLDKNNLGKAWKYASVAIRAKEYKTAIDPLLFLTQKSPETPNYWNQLASVYYNLKEYDKSIDAYKQLIKLEPNKKEDYLNLGIVYKDKGDLAKAREEYIKANKVAGGWGLAIFYEGMLYEQAASNCEFNFEAKLVYLLASNTYRKAYKIDPSLARAKDRVAALKSSVPSKEDYFFRGYKSGKVLPIKGKCYGWIDRSVTVP